MKRMKKRFFTTAATIACLLLGAGTISAQEAKVAKKIRIVTIEDGKKNVIDTTIIENDTLGTFAGETFYTVKDGKLVYGSAGDGRTICITSGDEAEEGNTRVITVTEKPGTRNHRSVTAIVDEDDAIKYNLTIDGVTVKITAPKDKAREAEEIIKEVKRIMNTK